MNVFEMIVVIVVFSVVAGVINNLIKARLAGQGSHKDVEESQDRIDDLEERVKVLETVITDQNFELRRQFRDLESD